MKSIARGFTLVELMVGLAIGLIATLAMVSVMINSEEQKRSTTGGMDAQVNGALALSAMMREIEKAGYGFSSFPAIIGCSLQNKYQGGSFASMPTSLVPVIITPGVNGAPDSIRSVAGNKSSFSVPINIQTPAYAPGAQFFSVASVRGVKGPVFDSSGQVVARGDLMVAAIDAAHPCQVFEVTADPSGAAVDRADTANWNPAGFPDQTYTQGAVLVNLGNVRDVTYSIMNGNLMQTGFVLATDGTATFGGFTLFNNIVQLQALYGKDTNTDGSVDSWDKTMPTTNAEWLQVIAVRVALLSRSTQREKDAVTFSNPTWDVGNGNPVAGSVACGGSRCLTLKIDNLTDWGHYRYKMFETVIPLRNMLWRS